MRPEICEIIAILRGITPEEVEPVGAALIEAGIGTVEVPLNSPRAFDSIDRLARRFAGSARIGAGTVLGPADVDRAVDAGATVILAPDCRPPVIAQARGRGAECWPGVFTATECLAAVDAGASGLKLFPATLLGPSGWVALSAVLPAGTRALAVGGIGIASMDDWLAVGIAGFGIGSMLYRPGDTARDVLPRARALVAALGAGRDSGR